MRDYIEAHPTNFKQALNSLRQSLNKEFAITLRIHSFFRHSRFRTGWLGDVGGKLYQYPEGYNDFVSTLLDRRFNSFEYLSKDEIQQRFGLAIKQNVEGGDTEVDEQGRFPKWEDLDSFLQYAYFHVDVEVSMRLLIGRSLEDLLGTFREVLAAEHTTMRTIAILHN